MKHLAIFAWALVCNLDCSAGDFSGGTSWPFTPLANTNEPHIQQVGWVRNGIDAFILSKLEKAGLVPSPEATRQTLVRRLYLDLIGLPPDPQAVDAFVASQDPLAYEKLVDQLLGDPRYGELWARYWLDLARYADTAGYEGDPDLPHAWRYRDYVIDSFNHDKPYDLFIREQIAGDEFTEIMGAGDLPEPEAERIVAMTFLRLAPFTEPRGDETRHELLSEMTSTVGSVFLGLTIGCAKCHDHKYDSIPTRDFYRMKAFFSTVRLERPERGDIYQIGGSIPAKFYRHAEQEWANSMKAKFESEIRESKSLFRDYAAQLENRGKTSSGGFGLQFIGAAHGNDYFFDTKTVSDGRVHFSIASSNGRSWSFFTDGKASKNTGTLSGTNNGHWFGDLPETAHISIGQHTNGKGTPKSMGHKGKIGEILIYDHPPDDTERRALSNYIQAKYFGAKISGPSAPPEKGLRFWLNATDLDANPATPNPSVGGKVTRWKDKVSGVRLEPFEKAELPILDTLGKANVPAVLFKDSFLKGAASQALFLNDQQGAIVVVFSAIHTSEGYGFEVGGSGSFISTVINPVAAQKGSLKDWLNDPHNDLFTKEERDRYFYLANRERFLRQQIKRLRPVAMSLRHSYGPPYEPGVPTSRVMVRGEYNNPGELVKAGFPSLITQHQDPASIRLDPFKRWPTRSRRMALANWIANPKNPLTARVMMNRLWHWHFGIGIVTTPSDFGKLSGSASHPELLDWLAHHFLVNGWRIKPMHRLIVTSAAYRQASRFPNIHAKTADPENKLLWKFRRRRLDAESIRDTILAVSGRLNPEMHGLPIFPTLPGDIAETVKYSESKWNTQHGPDGRKRSLYIYQQRTMTMPFMQVFDSLVCDESRPRRRASVTPLQALSLYNGDFINGEIRHFASRVKTETGDNPDHQLRYSFQLALGRPPTMEETGHLIPLLMAGKDRQQAIESLCRVLFNANEFIYID